MFIENVSDKELFNEVSRRTKNTPALIGDLLEISSKNWSDYIEALKAQRESEHVKSIHDVLHCIADRSKKFNETTIAMLIDPIKFGYPEGYKSVGCEFDRIILDKFTLTAINHWQPYDSFMELREMSAHLEMLYEQHPEIMFCNTSVRFVLCTESEPS